MAGQAKRRGTREERVKAAIALKESKKEMDYIPSVHIIDDRTQTCIDIKRILDKCMCTLKH